MQNSPYQHFLTTICVSNMSNSPRNEKSLAFSCSAPQESSKNNVLMKFWMWSLRRLSVASHCSTEADGSNAGNKFLSTLLCICDKYSFFLKMCSSGKPFVMSERADTFRRLVTIPPVRSSFNLRCLVFVYFRKCGGSNKASVIEGR